MKHKTNPVLDALLNRQRTRQRGHRRNMSDGRISSATEHLGEDVSRHQRYCPHPQNNPFQKFARQSSFSRLGRIPHYRAGRTLACLAATRGARTPSPPTPSAWTTRKTLGRPRGRGRRHVGLLPPGHRHLRIRHRRHRRQQQGEILGKSQVCEWRVCDATASESFRNSSTYDKCGTTSACKR